MLSDRDIRRLRPRRTDYLKADGGGLYVRVWPTGAKVWITRRMRAGKLQIETLGHWPDIDADAARARAATAVVEQKKRGGPDRRTVRELGTAFTTRVLQTAYKNPEPVARYVERDILPHLGRLPVRDVGPADCDAMLAAKLDESGPAAADMLYSVSKRMFAFAARTGWCEVSPMQNFRRADVGAKVKARSRTLTDDELRFLWHLGTSSIGAIRLAMATGCRISEAAECEWREFDLKRKRWSIPAHRTKQQAAHWYHLNGLALDVLRAQEEGEGRVFPIAHRVTIANEIKRQRRRGRKTDPDFTMHDARRTLVSRLGDAGYNPLVCEIVIGHALPRIAATYNTASYERERVQALEDWGDILARAIDGRAS